jgi:threonylcarbamoyladenosine tRNA methylthiotransferase MtaB
MAALEYALTEHGFCFAPTPSSADIVVVNTCSVTAHTEAKVRRLLARVARDAKHARILVTGCTAEQQGEELLRLPNVTWVVGNGRKHEIPNIILGDQKGVFLKDLFKESALPLVRIDPIPGRGGRTRFSVKIQEGCDHSCSYCIVPRLRGPNRCASFTDIIASCTNAIESGFKEIILTGTHIGQYRSQGGHTLIALLERLAGLPGDFRVRLSSLDPRELSGDILNLVGSHPKVCDHLHVSLQHCSPKVLLSMNRFCRDLDVLLTKLSDFRKCHPFAGLGADFIVGFPGESEKEFEDLLRSADAIGFSYAHIFRFSARPGTAATTMNMTVPERVKTERSGRLRSLIERQRQAFIKKQQGLERRIIVEKELPVRGTTANYLAVELPSFSALHNEWLNVIMRGTVLGRFCAADPKTKVT